MGAFLQVELAAGLAPGDPRETTRMQTIEPIPKDDGDVVITLEEEIQDQGVRDLRFTGKAPEDTRGDLVVFLLVGVRGFECNAHGGTFLHDSSPVSVPDLPPLG